MLVAIVVTVLAWSSAFVVIRGVGEHFGGGALALGRLLPAVVLLALLMLRSRWVRPTGREWMLIAGYGAFWFAAYNVALNIAEQTLDAGTAAMIVNIAPILVAVGSVVVFRDPLPRPLIAGIAIAFLGVVLIGFSTGGHPVSIAGAIWCLVAAVTYATGVLLQKPALARLPAAQVTWLGCVIGAVCCLPFAGGLVQDLAVAPVSATLGVLYLGVVPTALGFTTWAYALSRMPAAQLGVSTYVVPAITIVLALLVFGEVPAPLAIVGGVLSLAGVAVSRIRRRRDIPRTRVTTKPADLAE